MSFRFNPFTSNFDDVGSASVTPTYPTYSSLPGSAADGALAVVLDTDLLYVFDGTTSTWKIIGVPEPIKATLYDPLATSTTSGAAATNPYTVDGQVVATGDRVLFTNLGTGNNEIYQAAVSGGSITWVTVNVFTGLTTPEIGDEIVIQYGTGFANAIGLFNGTTWVFNQTVRYYNGLDYSQQDAIVTSTLVNNTTNGTVFSVAWLGSENISLDYSINRGGIKEAGKLILTTDGITVGISALSSTTDDAGVSFNALISGSDILLRYTTTNTGSDAVMRYITNRWSDNVGGPSGVPSYSAGALASQAGGNNTNVQFNSSGVLAGNDNFNYDAVNNIVELGEMQTSILNSSTINDNQSSPLTIISFPSSYSSAVFDYSVSRGGAVRTGRFLLATDGVLSSFFDDFVEQGSTGVTFTDSISGSDVIIKYTSTNTGSAGTLKYSFRRWSA